jgi:hypothetical protein
MAKASKTRAKQRSRTQKGRTATAKPSRSQPQLEITPIHLAADSSITIGLHDVVRALKVIERHGHLNKLVSATKRQQAAVTIPAATVNLVKDFIVKHGMHKHPVGKHIITGTGTPTGDRRRASISGDGGDPNQCTFGTLGRG